MKYRFAKRALILCAALITLNPVLSEEFKNSVVNLKFNKDATGCVNVKVVTSKPYNSPIFVNEKQNNTYVILLPETRNALAGKPLLNNVTGEISCVTINTRPYVDGGAKGYTKITIVSPKPISIYATASVNVSNSQPVINKPKVVQGKSQPVQPPKAQVTVLAKQTSQSSKPQVAQVKPQTTQSVKPQVAQVKPQAKQTVKPQVAQVKPQAKQTVKPQVAQVKSQALEQQKTKTIKNETQQKSKKNLFNIDKLKSVSIDLNYKLHNSLNTLNLVAKNKFADLADLINLKNNLVKLLLILSAIGFPLIVIFFIVLMNRRIKEQIEKVKEYNEQEDVNLPIVNIEDEVPEEVENEEENENEFSQNREAEVLEETNVSFSEMLDNTVKDETIDENPLNQDINDFINEEEPTDEEIDESAESVEELIVEETEEVEEPVEELIDEETGEFEEPAEELIDEETDEVEEPAEESIEEVTDEVEEPAEESIEEVTDEVEEPAEELIDEETDEVEEPAEELIDEESEEIEEPAEELIDEETEEFEEPAEELIEEVTDEVEEPAEELIDVEIEEVEESAEELIDDEQIDLEYEPDGFINEYEDNDDDSIFDELRNNTITIDEDVIESEESNEDDTVFDELRGEYETTVDGLTVLAHTPVNSVSGFYLVNFENFSSLIGYIKDEIFVLKTFDEFVNNNIYIKPAEQLSESTYRYIVRIGLYKMVIEVSDKKMSHLIDL